MTIGSAPETGKMRGSIRRSGDAGRRYVCSLLAVHRPLLLTYRCLVDVCMHVTMQILYRPVHMHLVTTLYRPLFSVISEQQICGLFGEGSDVFGKLESSVQDSISAIRANSNYARMDHGLSARASHAHSEHV